MEIRRDDIPDSMLNLMDIVGMENLIKITKIYGGYALYIPYYKTLVRDARNREIINSYNGFNTRELADKYNLSSGHIHKIVRYGLPKKV